MKREFWAAFDLYHTLQRLQEENKALLDSLVGRTSLSGPWDVISDPACRQHLLAQVLASEAKVSYRRKKRSRTARVKEYARTGVLRDQEPSGVLYWYYGQNDHVDTRIAEEGFQRFLQERLRWMNRIFSIGEMEGDAAPFNLTSFPPGSWSIRFTFTLRTPYLSKDDTDFYILDNPIKKEWVFKVPYVAPSQWKGALRAAMMRNLASDLQAGRVDEEQFVAERLRLYRLFGNEKDGAAGFLNRAWASHRVGPRPETETESTEWEKQFRREVERVSSQFEQRLREHKYRVGDVEGFQGRLHFYPTFFNRIGLEVINPHDRETGAGRQPIYFECVPVGATGTFTLLYVPWADSALSPDEIRRQAAEDVEAVAQGVEAMMTRYGFGAKTSSGYGVADVEVETVTVQPPSQREVFLKAWSKSDADD